MLLGRKKERKTDRQTDKQTDRQTDRKKKKKKKKKKQIDTFFEGVMSAAMFGYARPLLRNRLRGLGAPATSTSANAMTEGMGRRKNSATINANGSFRSSSSASCVATAASGAAAGGVDDLPALIKKKNEENAIMVYSKSWCPFCSEVKRVLLSAVEAVNGDPSGITIVELDALADGDEVQAALMSITGMRTVPQVFIGGSLIGGCDDTLAVERAGKLDEMIKRALQ